MGKLKFLLVLLLALSLTGFICEDTKKEDPAQGRVYNSSSSCYIYSVAYGSAEWNATIYPYNYSPYRDIKGSNYLTFVADYGSSYAEFTSPYPLEEPDPGKKYTIDIYSSDCTNYTIYLPSEPDKGIETFKLQLME